MRGYAERLIMVFVSRLMRQAPCGASLEQVTALRAVRFWHS